MNTDIAIRLFYKGGGITSSDITMEDINQLKSELQETYVASIQDTRGPQAGGVLDTIVNIFILTPLTNATTKRDFLIPPL